MQDIERGEPASPGSASGRLLTSACDCGFNRSVQHLDSQS
jgi:hypothetical protein